jgi:hypothetical protein
MLRPVVNGTFVSCHANREPVVMIFMSRLFRISLKTLFKFAVIGSVNASLLKVPQLVNVLF